MLPCLGLPAIAAFACFASIGAQAAEPPAFPYRHLWTDQQGVSHLASCTMRGFGLASMAKPADPQWQDGRSGSGHVVMTVQPAGWNGAWHEDPKPQWVVPLTGSWFVEAQDGTRAEMGPGELLLGEDQNTRPGPDGRKGHLAGNVGQGSVQLMVVQLDVPSTVDEPCRFR